MKKFLFSLLLTVLALAFVFCMCGLILGMVSFFWFHDAGALPFIWLLLGPTLVGGIVIFLYKPFRDALLADGSWAMLIPWW
jgi:hypothetical protein